MRLHATGSLAALTLLALAGCADGDTVPRAGIDQDISATHDADGPSLFSWGERSTLPWNAFRNP